MAFGAVIDRVERALATDLTNQTSSPGLSKILKNYFPEMTDPESTKINTFSAANYSFLNYTFAFSTLELVHFHKALVALENA